MRTVKEKILKEISDWCDTQNKHPNVDEIVDMAISKTSEELFETIRKELEQEFSKGNLEHPFFISNEYYLELKLKDIKNKFSTTSIKETEDEHTS